MALAILLRFNAIADRRHSSVAARMPCFRIFKRLCSLFIATKLHSANIFHFLIMYRYFGVLTLNTLCKTQDSNCWPKFFYAHRPYQNKSSGKCISGRHLPVPGSNEDISLWTYCSSDRDIQEAVPLGNKCILLRII